MNTNHHLGRRLLTAALITGAWLGATTHAMAQDAYPSKPIRFVVPFAAGGALDYIARTIGAEITKQTKVQVIVDNRPGASGFLAAENIKRSPADGYSVLISNMDTFVNNIGMFKTLPYDPLRDFQPAGMIAGGAAILVANGSVPAKTLDEFVTYAKKPQANISFGTWGTGTYSHVAAESFARTKGLSINSVPYKGETPVVQDLLGGNITIAMASVLVAKAQTEKGAMKAYAVNGDKRLALMPDVPTFKELGYTDPVLMLRPWFAAYLPAGTPKPIVDKFNALLRDAINDPVISRSFSDKGFDPIGSTIAEHQSELQQQIQTFTRVMREIGIQQE
jgi:tripartite-type tricarboxylate transporter receptor subunit TctC